MPESTGTTTTTFRWTHDFQELLGRMSKALNTTRTETVQRSVVLVAQLLNEASRSSYADLEALRERYGNDARIVMGVFEEGGLPVGRLLINGEDPGDVKARPFVDAAAGEAHMFLDVLRPHVVEAQFAKIGDEALFVAHPRFPVGVLPWPPKPNLAIQILLADIEAAAKEAEQAAKELIEL